jgi:hypothetical protein
LSVTSGGNGGPVTAAAGGAATAGRQIGQYAANTYRITVAAPGLEWTTEDIIEIGETAPPVRQRAATAVLGQLARWRTRR